MAEKVTIMKLKVDLECEKCQRKVKKLLCKYRQIQGQQYDKKENIVKIEVVCCSPEKLREKLCYNGGGSIKSIEIVEPAKPKKGVTFANPISETRYFDKDTIDSQKDIIVLSTQKDTMGMDTRDIVQPPMAVPVGYYPYSPLPHPWHAGSPIGPYCNYGGPVLCYGRPLYGSNDDNCPIM